MIFLPRYISVDFSPFQITQLIIWRIKTLHFNVMILSLSKKSNVSELMNSNADGNDRGNCDDDGHGGECGGDEAGDDADCWW